MITKTKQQTVVPYFMVRNAPAFIRFAKEVFGAELISSQTREQSEDVIHAEIEIGAARIFVADSGYCDGEWISPSSLAEGKCSRMSDGAKPIQMFVYVGAKPIQMFVYVENTDETCRKAVASGGAVVMEPYDDDGGRMCGIADPFENLWWLKSTKGTV
jgi:PhnB protein